MPNPTVTSVLPAPNATDVVLGSSILVTFSEPINTDTLNNATFALTGPGPVEIVTVHQIQELNPEPARGKGYILGTFTFSTVTFKPWVAFTAYHIGDQVVDSNGNAQTASEAGVSSPYAPAWQTTEATSTVDSNLPAWQALTHYNFGAFILDLNGNLQKCTTSVGGSSGPKMPSSWNPILSGTTFDGSVTWTNYGPLDPVVWTNGGPANSGVTIATFIPAKPLTPGTTYTVLIVGRDSVLANSYVEDVSGNPMLTSYQWSFTTGTLQISTPPVQNPIASLRTFIRPEQIQVIPRAAVGNDVSVVELIFPAPIDTNSFDPAQLLIGLEGIMNDPDIIVPGGAHASYIVQGNKLIVTVTGLS
jgi:hypothetical protein